MSSSQRSNSAQGLIDSLLPSEEQEQSSIEHSNSNLYERTIALRHINKSASSHPSPPQPPQVQLQPAPPPQLLTPTPAAVSTPYYTPAEELAQEFQDREEQKRNLDIPSSPIEAQLKQAEVYRLAQNRIRELENEIEKWRRENEQLTSAGEVLASRVDELKKQLTSAERQVQTEQEKFIEQVEFLETQLQVKDLKLKESQDRINELESRLEVNFRQIRVRERELEHRLELVRLEGSALLNTKDDLLVQLKNDIDLLKLENESLKRKIDEASRLASEKQENISQVSRALRMALNNLSLDTKPTALSSAGSEEKNGDE